MRRIAPWLAIAAGVVLVVLPLAYSMFDRTSEAEQILDRFTFLTADENPQRYLDEAALTRDGSEQLADEAIPALAAAAGVSEAQLDAASPALATAQSDLPAARDFSIRYSEQLDAVKAKFQAVYDIPTPSLPLTVVPYMLLIAGLLSIGLGVAALRTGSRGLLWGLLALGIAMALGPVALGGIGNVSDAEDVKDFAQNGLTQRAADAAQGASATLDSLVAETESETLPLIAESSGQTPAEVEASMAADYPRRRFMYDKTPHLPGEPGALSLGQQAERMAGTDRRVHCAVVSFSLRAPSCRRFCSARRRSLREQKLDADAVPTPELVEAEWSAVNSGVGRAAFAPAAARLIASSPSPRNWDGPMNPACRIMPSVLAIGADAASRAASDGDAVQVVLGAAARGEMDRHSRLLAPRSGSPSDHAFSGRTGAIGFRGAAGGGERLLCGGVRRFARLFQNAGENVPIFLGSGHGSDRRVLGESTDAVALKNTWGDAIHLVIPDVRRAARSALPCNAGFSDRRSPISAATMRRRCGSAPIMGRSSKAGIRSPQSHVLWPGAVTRGAHRTDHPPGTVT